MKFFNQFIIVLVVVVYLTSCSKEVKVKIPEMKDGLTLFCDATTGSPLSVVVGKSTSVLKYNRNQELTITTAAVKLYADGQYIETLQYDDEQGVYTSIAIIEAAKLYKLTAEAAGYTTIEAEATAPARVELSIVRITDTSKPSPYGGGLEMATAVTLQFNDPGLTPEYYQLNFYSAFQVFYGDSMSQSGECIDIDDPSITQGFNLIDGTSCLSGDIIFDDQLFNGKRKQLTASVSAYSTFPVPNTSGDSIYSVFKLSYISEALYRYIKTYEKALETDGNPFAEPVNVYTNVKNGHGIFSITNPATVQVRHK